MKTKTKFTLGAAALLVAVLAVVLTVVAFSLGAVVKKGVETFGPSATRVDVKLKSADVSLFAGRGQLAGFVLGNPPGCKTPAAIVVDKVSFRVKRGSVFSDKVVVESLQINAPVITLEGGVSDNNLKTIEKNLEDYCASPSTTPKPPAPSSGPAKSGRTFQVNELVITGAKLQINTTLSANRTITVPIPDIHLAGLGTGPEGITAAELGQKVLRAVLAEAMTTAATTLAKEANDLGKKTLGTARDAAQKAAGTLKGLIP
jgi:uncharacterized protein involved in outer membrane biogenesis